MLFNWCTGHGWSSVTEEAKLKESTSGGAGRDSAQDSYSVLSYSVLRAATVSSVALLSKPFVWSCCVTRRHGTEGGLLLWNW